MDHLARGRRVRVHPPTAAARLLARVYMRAYVWISSVWVREHTSNTYSCIHADPQID